MNIANCPRCGRIFAPGLKDVCSACAKEVEQQYERCVQYLRDNRGATITEVSENTEVPIKQITKFIREGRISLVNAPNMSYPCDVCGILIREGNMCETCRKRLTQDVNTLKEQEQRRREEIRKSMTYRSRD
ncbi:TIGR03826 family flagellar region protein [Paenibacillaceae bacterium T2]|uniref:TIGR03826 family flagellar region protein n=1 Tax=Ferviditalea candida TaxID=3108399 RepID=A0ABU5ZIL0_9BACL|nr:TIGR03826 family flagellar region protein [Paenibacillaceae bacterium T2]